MNKIFITTHKIIIPVKPMGQPRPRSTIRNGKIHVYETKEVKTYKQAIQMLLNNKFKEKAITEPIACKIMFLFENKNRIDEPYDKKPDIDNLCKSVMDSANKLIYTDDCLVYHLSAEKRYSEFNRIEFYIQREHTLESAIEYFIDTMGIYSLARSINVSWRTIHRLKKGGNVVSDQMKCFIAYKLSLIG